MVAVAGVAGGESEGHAASTQVQEGCTSVHIAPLTALILIILLDCFL